MLGFHFQFNDSYCGVYSDLCTESERWIPGNNTAYDAVCFHQKKRFQNGTDSKCRSASDVMCLNDVCMRDARCDGPIECSNGEDEYRCQSQNAFLLSYRGMKKQRPCKYFSRKNASQTRLFCVRNAKN